MGIKSILQRSFKSVRLFRNKIIWRMKNKHNSTTAKSLFDFDQVCVGLGTYGPIEILYNSPHSKLTIGHYCSIANEVKFFLGGVHDYRRISTFPFQTRIYHGVVKTENERSLDIVVEDDVWIGYDCVVLPGTIIGKGSVIGARSVVTGHIPPYSIYVGNKVIKKRFPDEIIEVLERIDFSTVHHHQNDSYQQYCATVITEDNISEVLKAFAQQG